MVENLISVNKDEFVTDTLNKSFDTGRYSVHYIAYGVIGHENMGAAGSTSTSKIES